MENSPLVSIVIPIYNAEKYLNECLDSCLKQSYKNIEVIAVNDGSKDRSGDIVKSYVAIDSRVKYFCHDNRGVSFTREIGINASTGEYIMFVDADDFIDENFVEKMMSVILRDHSDMVFCEAYRWYDGTKKEHYLINPNDLKICSGIDYLEAYLTTYMWGKIYKRKYVVNTILQKSNLCEDMFFNMQVLPKCEKVSYLRDYLYYYRFNESSITNNADLMARYISLIDHSYELESCINNFNLTSRVKYIVRYRNFSNIREALMIKFYNKKDIDKLINLMLKEYKYYFKSYKLFKLAILLIISKYYPRLLNKIKS